MPKLKSISGELEGQEFPLGKEPLILGRRAGNAIVIDHNKASRSHAEVGIKSGKAYVRDLNSSNGTYVNGIRLDPATPRVLEAGDEITVGNTILRYFDRDTALPDVEIPGIEIEEVLAQGGMGTIYRARQISMDRPVALKILNAEYAKRKEFVNRFIQEARAAGKLNHPNIIHVHNVGKAGDCYYFAMELVKGKNLSQAAVDSDDLDTRTIVSACARVADALEYAHERGIIHRDVKPDNIILDEHNDAKLADLGIAKTFEIPEDNNPKRVLGTPHYMSPEQASGKPIDGRSDLYSLGATLYFLLANAPVFDATRSKEVMAMHVRDKPRPLAEAATDAPASLCAIVDKLLAKKPADRFQTAAEVRDALDAVVEELDKAPPKKKLTTSKKTKTGARSGRPKGGGTAPRRAIKGRARGRTASHAKKKPPVVEIAIAGVFLFLALIGILFMGGSGDSGSGGSGGGDAGGGANAGLSADDVLREGDILAAQEDWDSALARYQRVLNEFPAADHPREHARARAEIERIQHERRELAEAEAMRDAWRDFEKNRADFSPSRMDKELSAMWEKYPDLRDKIRAEKAKLRADEESAEAWQNARNEVSQAIIRNRFDEARSHVDQFAQQHPGVATDAQLEELRQEIESKATATFDVLKKQVDAQREGRQYGPALLALRDFRGRIQDRRLIDEAERMEKDIEGELNTAFAQARTGVRQKLATLDFRGALGILRDARPPFRGTPTEKKIEALEQLTRDAATLHEKVIRTMKAKPWKVSDEFDLPVLKGQKNRSITGADESGIWVSMGALRTQARWNQLSIEQIYRIYDHYVPPSAEAERKLILDLRKFLGI